MIPSGAATDLLSKSMRTESGRKAVLRSVLNPLELMERMAEAGPEPGFEPGPLASQIVKMALMRRVLEEIRAVDGPNVAVPATNGFGKLTTVSHLISKLDWSVSKISGWPGMEEAIAAAYVLAT